MSEEDLNKLNRALEVKIRALETEGHKVVKESANPSYTPYTMLNKLKKATQLFQQAFQLEKAASLICRELCE